jgi:uncharacterized protein (UPF0332 family)
MSKSGNMVSWCLEKAQKEIAKGQKHRGLIKTKPNIQQAKDHIKKAESNIEAFILNRDNGHHDWAISMGFYAMYHCCLAILSKFGYESRNQECTLALVASLCEEGKIEKEFILYISAMKSDSSTEDQIIEMREKYQYSTAADIDKQKIARLLSLCQDMIVETRGIIA